jgi:hypothetical protein
MTKSAQNADTTESESANFAPEFTSEQRTALNRRIAIENAPAWRPDPGDLITGKLIDVSWYEHEEYGKSPVMTLAVGSNNTFARVYSIHQTLTAKLMELRPPLGETVTVHYGGQKASNSRKDSKGDPVQYHQYTVFTGDPLAATEVPSGELPW